MSGYIPINHIRHLSQNELWIPSSGSTFSIQRQESLKSVPHESKQEAIRLLSMNTVPVLKFSHFILWYLT